MDNRGLMSKAISATGSRRDHFERRLAFLILPGESDFARYGRSWMNNRCHCVEWAGGTGMTQGGVAIPSIFVC
jgi:hypothetical protein